MIDALATFVMIWSVHWPVSIDGLSSELSAGLRGSSLVQLVKMTMKLSEYLEGPRGRRQRRQKTERYSVCSIFDMSARPGGPGDR